MADSLEILALSEMGQPNSEEKFFFFNSENNNNLTSIDHLGVVVVYPSAPVSIINIPASVTTDIIITDNQIGLNITGGYTLDGGSITVIGTGQVTIIG